MSKKGILAKLFPPNYTPYSERNVPSYHYSSLRSQPKYDACHRPRGTSVADWNDWVEADVRAQVCKYLDGLDLKANVAKFDNALYCAANPEALRDVPQSERPPERLLQAARDYHAGKLK